MRCMHQQNNDKRSWLLNIVTNFFLLCLCVIMGCNVGCPFIGRDFDDNWGLEDPTGKSDEEFRIIIKEIENRILQLKERIYYE